MTRSVGSKVELLLVKRSRPPAAGQWSVPGGRMEAGETLRQCAEREVMEETGLAVRAEERGVYAFDVRVTPQLQYVVVDVLATLEDNDGVPKAGDDASEAVFVGRKAFDLLPVNEETRRLVKQVGLLERLA